MLPFPVLNQYNNLVDKHWYNGNELIAWDSKIYNSNGFIDYTGKNISVGLGVASQPGTLLPSVSNEVFSYGSMVHMGHGAYIGTIGDVISNSVLSEDWCIDFWLKNIGTGYGVYPLISLPDVKTHNTSSRLYVTSTSSSSGIVSVAVASGQVNASSKWSTFFDKDIHHYCIQYIKSTSTWRFYCDGILLQILTLNIAENLSRKDITIASTNTSYDAYVERYRLRNGIFYTSDNFDLNNLY